MVQIRSTTGETLYEGNHRSLKCAAEAAVRSGAVLSGAVLSGAVMPGRPDDAPTTRAAAIGKVRDWFADGHWVKGQWIDTPSGAYSGDCRACLHGALSYLGGRFGPELQEQFSAAGYTVSWNDDPGRTAEDVIEACEKMMETVGGAAPDALNPTEVA